MARKKISRSKTKITEKIERNLIEDVSSSTAFPLNIKKSKALLIGLVIALLALLYYLRGLFVAAIVNGQPITRFTVVSELERQSGKQTLQSLVTKTLILQEAKKQNVNVPDKEVDEELAKAEANLKSQGQDLDQILAAQGLTRASVREQIYIEKLIEKLLSKNAAVTDKEINEYFEKNKDTFQDATDEAKVKESIKQQLSQQKMSSEFQKWMQELQKNAKINYFVQY